MLQGFDHLAQGCAFFPFLQAQITKGLIVRGAVDPGVKLKSRLPLPAPEEARRKSSTLVVKSARCGDRFDSLVRV